MPSLDLTHPIRLMENSIMDRLKAGIRRPLFLLCAAALSLTACGDNTNPANSKTDALTVPSAYIFDSRFNPDQSSVDYSGQVVRNLLIQDLKVFIEDLATPGAQPADLQDLLNFYEYDDGLDLASLSNAGAKPVVENRYSSISIGKNLVGKIADAPVIGYNRTADALIRDWFAVIATQSQAPDKLGTPAVYTDANGVDLNQMINKVLIGAVPYYQSTGIYLDGLFERDNAVPRSQGNAATAMEHAWDEAFGYFGAARDYARYSDTQLAGSANDFTYDSNGDGRIDFTSEYNFGLSRNAAKRDKDGTGINFTGDLFNAFLTGRTLIAHQGTVTQIAAQRELAANGMEKVIAATVVHYINATLADMAALGTTTENRVNLNKHWAEMKGFTVALQYNPFRLISAGQLQELHTIMGQAPAYTPPGSAAYTTAVANYARAKDILQGAYGFSADNMANW